MKLNLRKISSVLACTAMLGSTLGFAAAASYPAPFVSGGSANVAVVVGSSAASSDMLAATDVGSNLNAALASQTIGVGGTPSVTGESEELYGSKKIYVNDSLNVVRNIVTDSDLPTVLKDSTISGNVDAKATFSIVLSSTPRVIYGEMPTTSDDPSYGLDIPDGSAQTNNIYNATVSFNKAINFTHADTEGEEITLFGQDFTVAADTDSTKLVLLKAAEKFTLSSDADSQSVTIGGSTYTVKLISASDTSATVAVTNAAGNTETKEINEAASKKVNGLTIAVNTADENNLKYTATLIAGAEKVTFTNQSTVTFGEDDTSVDGTYVTFDNGPTSLTTIKVSVAADDSDEDAILPGQSFVDPVFGSFKIDFGAGLNIADTSDERENIYIKPSGDDKMLVKFTSHQGEEKEFQYARNATGNTFLQIDDSGRNITVLENDATYRNNYVVVGNEDEAYLLKISTVNNASTGHSDDKVTFTDVFSGSTYETTMTGEGTGNVNVGGNQYTVTYAGASGNNDAVVIRIGDPDSSGNDKNLFPTIRTSKGANLAFTAPIEINLTTHSLDGANIRIPDGDGYTAVAVASAGGTTNYTFGGTNVNLTAAAGASSATVTVGKITYNFTSNAKLNVTKVFVTAVSGGNIIDPAIVVFEEQDDDNDYEALIVKLDTGGTSDDGIGVSDVERTWDGDNTAWELSLSSDSDLQKEADLWGSIILIDSSDSDQASATISYPDEQVYAQIYASSSDAIITAGAGVTTIVPVKDSEVSSVSSKNLVVVGGSCVNTVAAKLLGSDSAICGPEFTAKTTVGSGEYLIQTFQSPYSTSAIATLVAGYEATDTQNAVSSLKANKPDTTVGKKFKGTTAGSIIAA